MIDYFCVMKRQVLIIKGFSKDDKERQATEKMIGFYKAYFISNAGGAYEENEVVLMNDPQLKDITALYEKDAPNYLITILIGHGGIQDEVQLFKLNSKEIILPGQLELGVSKRLVILESCRTLVDNYEVVKLDSIVPSYKDGGVIRKMLTKSRSKELYLEALSKCDDGLTVAFACGEDEKASSFYFSNKLIELATRWHNDIKNHENVLGISPLVNAVSEEVAKISRSRSKEQTPETKGSVDFPFTVSKF